MSAHAIECYPMIESSNRADAPLLKMREILHRDEVSLTRWAASLPSPELRAQIEAVQAWVPRVRERAKSRDTDVVWYQKILACAYRAVVVRQLGLRPSHLDQKERYIERSILPAMNAPLEVRQDYGLDDTRERDRSACELGSVNKRMDDFFQAVEHSVATRRIQLPLEPPEKS